MHVLLAHLPQTHLLFSIVLTQLSLPSYSTQSRSLSETVSQYLNMVESTECSTVFIVVLIVVPFRWAWRRWRWSFFSGFSFFTSIVFTGIVFSICFFRINELHSLLFDFRGLQKDLSKGWKCVWKTYHVNVASLFTKFYSLQALKGAVAI
jgi:hypothetical protein